MNISVIVPVYNEEKYLEKCLKSLVNQEIQADEIIVVDNNCTDKTIPIAKKFAVKIVKENQQGIIFARNKGFNTAQGDILARCDADSILPANWVKKIKENFTRCNPASGFTKRRIDALTGPVIFYDLPLKTTAYSIFYMKLMKFLQKGESLCGPNMAITKKVWQKIKNDVCADEKIIHEDIDLSLHILKTGGGILYDWSLIIKASGRRIKNNPFSFFIEYPIRLIKNLHSHRF